MTRHAPTRTVCSRRRRHDGFTIVELLVVIFIIALLITISMFVINKARRSANVARLQADFIAVSTALDQFKADHKAFPGMIPNLPPGVDRNNALAYCLVAPGPASEDGGEGPGFRVQKGSTSTKLWPAYLDVSKFKVVKEPTLPNGTKVSRGSYGWELLDAYNVPIVYLPRRKPAVRPNIGLLGDLNSGAIAAFDVMDVDGLLNGEQQKALLMALGDRNVNNKIDAGETSKFGGDYVLMSAGPDGAYYGGSDPVAFEKADDVYNFDR